MALPRRKNVADLPLGVYTGTAEPIEVRDPIYPRKSEVNRRSRFSFHGHRSDDVTTWVVENITTVCKSESGRFVEAPVFNVRLLDDILLMRCLETRERRRIRFRTLSYSAAWRLEPED